MLHTTLAAYYNPVFDLAFCSLTLFLLVSTRSLILFFHESPSLLCRPWCYARVGSTGCFGWLAVIDRECYFAGFVSATVWRNNVHPGLFFAFTTSQFSMFPHSGSALCLPLGLGLRDTASCVWGRRWKHRGGVVRSLWGWHVRKQIPDLLVSRRKMNTRRGVVAAYRADYCGDESIFSSPKLEAFQFCHRSRVLV